MFLAFRCARKRAFRRVNRLLEVENRQFRAKYSCEWSINRKLTNLTLRRTGAPVANIGYPAQPVAGENPFGGQHLPTECNTAPLYTEQPHQPAPYHGYNRVSLDDSNIGYAYQ